MKTLIVLIAAMFSSSLAFMSHDQIVAQLSQQKVGHAPQMGKPVQYDKLNEVLPNRKKRKHHNRRAHYDQRFARKNLPSVSPSPIGTPSISPAPSITPNVPSGNGSPSPTNTPNAGGTGQGADLRKCDSPIKTQNTPWCTAFSFAAVMENMVCDHQSLSIHHIWSLYQVYSVDSAASSVPGTKITTWNEWPESSNTPMTNYEDFAKHSLSSMVYIDQSDDIAYAMKVLDSGRPIYVGMAVPADMASCYATIRATTRITSGGHALEIAGYGLDPKVGGGGYFIIKQSWGTSCGDNGYQYMPFSVCDNQGMYCEFYEPKGIN